MRAAVTQVPDVGGGGCLDGRTDGWMDGWTLGRSVGGREMAMEHHSPPAWSVMLTGYGATCEGWEVRCASIACIIASETVTIFHLPPGSWSTRTPTSHVIWSKRSVCC